VWASFHAAGVSPVGFLEELARTLPIRALLVKRLGVPFTTVGSEEVASINMDRSRESQRQSESAVKAAGEWPARWRTNAAAEWIGRYAHRNYERFLGLAQEAQRNGDAIEMEDCHQHAEHYFRVMNDRGWTCRAARHSRACC